MDELNNIKEKITVYYNSGFVVVFRRSLHYNTVSSALLKETVNM